MDASQMECPHRPGYNVFSPLDAVPAVVRDLLGLLKKKERNKIVGLAI